MKKRIVIITGANSGIGKEAALRFAKAGDHVIMACRNMEFSRKVQTGIIAAANNDQVDLLELDVSSFASIRCFCDTFSSWYERLDILIHNAAYFSHGERYRQSPDGIELTFATNVFGPYLMTSLLLDQLKKSADPRILHAGSNIIKHFFDPKQSFDLDLLQGREDSNKSFSVYQMYCQSKMALTLLTFKMAEAFADDGIKVNALQINGAKMSKRTIQKVKPWWRPIARVQNIFFRPPSYMAENYFQICTADNYKHVTGKLFNDKLEIMQPSPREYPGFFKQLKQLLGSSTYPACENTNIREELWQLCTKLIESHLHTSIDDQKNWSDQ
ncbi:NAD(P)-dependent dehydrogenase, short-chain alcohol dehydrogenase family [Evansella caseinilytica]|uniref:NAD(P)-dependent dehydrogenase, short-chain alcohol dehydrogenase family n=1 Tax=Evansella caseinilytica TaxID=1503961 RepID=A0A1H3SP65_9BACI|nr:SDR family oxidoreductase [Evansella caseinilytica]SDZ39345.1 NAD(P)-dependent dehydrogenase, short-chain alcohol dehydrogenase family [Evansella caseinilytica]